MFNISLPFYPIRQYEEKTIFHLLTEGVLYEIFYNLLHSLHSNIRMAHSFSTIRKNILTEEKFAL